MVDFFDINDFHGIKADLNASKIITDLAKQTVQKLEEASPKGERYKNARTRSKSYAKTWTFVYYPQYDEAVVYNKENYWLTHLLEHGHFDATKVGSPDWVNAQEHIKTVFDELPDTLDKIVYQTDIDFDIY